MEKTGFRNFVKGIVVGGSMLIPGVSGGTMAMILGIYHHLIQAVGDFRANPKWHGRLLLTFGLGGLLGLWLLSTPMEYLFLQHPFPLLYFFMGAILGGLPLLYQEAGKPKLNVKTGCYFLLGVLIVWCLGLLEAPPELAQPAALKSDWQLVAKLVLAGIVAAIALILPGISVSYFLLILGLYGATVQAIQQLQWTFLLPLGIGLGIGIIATSKLLAMAMKRYPRFTYLLILGFMGGSLLQIFPGIPPARLLLPCCMLFLLGFGIIYWMSKREMAAL